MAPLHQRYVSIMVAVLKFHYRKQLFYVLRGKDDRIFLLINNRLCSGCGASSGNALSVACIGPAMHEGTYSMSLRLRVVRRTHRYSKVRLKMRGSGVRIIFPSFLSMYPMSLAVGSAGIIDVNVCILEV